MKKFINQEESDYEKNWAICSAGSIDLCFDQLNDESTDLEFRTGIKLGAIEEQADFTEFQEFLKKCSDPNQSDNNKLSLCMGMAERERDFSFFFKFSSRESPTSEWVDTCYGIDSFLDRYIAGPLDIKVDQTAKLRYGITPDLVRDYTNNWLRTPPAMRSVMFYATQKITDPLHYKNSIRRVVRVKRFNVSLLNAQYLERMIKNRQCEIDVLFGVNPANFLMDDDMFTPIIRVTEPANEGGQPVESYVEFLHPCPPFCPPPDGSVG